MMDLAEAEMRGQGAVITRHPGTLGYGDVLGAGSRIFGYEVDGLSYEIKDGVPFPTGEDGASTDIEIIGLGLGTNEEADHGIWGETLYIGSADAEWLAEALHGVLTDETYQTLRSSTVAFAIASVNRTRNKEDLSRLSIIV